MTLPQKVLSSTLKEWIDRDEAVVIDVREPNEYAAGHIKGSVLLPLGRLAVTDLPPTRGKKLVMQCRSGGRSAVACERLIAEDSSLEPINLVGGILAWEQAGFAIER